MDVSARTEDPRDRTVHGRFERWARECPQRNAVVDGEVSLSYARLDAWASSLAAGLVRDGIRVEDAVAVMVPRGHRSIVAFLAVLKAGACYVPVDPDYPPARTDLMREDSGSVRTLTAADVDAAAADLLPAAPVAVAPQNRAYVVYTSGSTGRPKGVMVEHRNVCALMDEPRLGVAAGETVAQTVSISFDVATFEIWGALCHGGTLVIMPGGRSLEELAGAVRRHRPDWMFLTAGVFHLMVDHDPDALASVGTLQAGGDVLAPAQWNRAAPQPRRGLFNAYGPSETTVYSALYQAVPGEQVDSVPIGSPPAAEHIALDDTGEILIGGAGVSRGYHDRPRLTAARFVPDPDSPVPGGRRYHSGDLGSLAPDGSYLIHGRIDRQVKVRGHRIELPEIENVLAGHPGVGQAAVRTFDVGAQKRLAGFVSPAAHAAPTAPDLLAWLRDRLPAYMVPAVLQVLEEVPLDPNGKIDRAALASPWSSRAHLRDLDDAVPPADALEEELAALWADALQLDSVGRDDNFYLLGGDSLRGIGLMAELAAHGHELSAEEFLSHQTVAELAGHLRERAGELEGAPA